MATAIMTALASVFLPTQFTNSRRCFFNAYYTPLIKQRSSSFASKIRASSTAFVETKPLDPVVVEKEVSISKNILACPVCYEPLSWIGDRVLSVDCAGSSLHCGCCKKTYSGKETHLELTVASGSSKFDDSMPLATELFRLPLISFLYERGWRQNFIWGGFPGPEKEPGLGGNIIDASCGSGLFSRLFAKSGLFSHVVALDYSENMLRQCYEFIMQEENFPRENLILVRADISRLPFLSGSVDAVHAGAAIHCWPSPSAAVAEISRVLKPEGVFVATTFILDGPFSFFPLLGPLRQNMALAGNHIFLHERELEDICRACGLVGFTAIRNGRFVMFSARKPS
ncbi:hypothetical protein P3X46_021714 [Hevea brasiliensis]|uniref:Methyltransferase type 11 domain-containing protein n=1 Tax=Hevea brasiliensis TaxID=3981 RepID=A0ABQ9LK92_HEVBR|nr:uncharacterized methyltransferase At1g78140, chloroplastic isoform X2 [Hevea brasiliensis]KAJ9167031.1 hypothetical protein P3X46_021714 [Hevea brasiliensis]